VSETNHEVFVRTCLSAFRRLVDKYGFAEPVVETYVRYRKGLHEVSIAYEPYSAPIVEFFYPSSETGERPTPWAEMDGVQRTRRFPNYRIDVRFKDSDQASFAPYLEATASALERDEREYLQAPASGQ